MRSTIHSIVSRVRTSPAVLAALALLLAACGGEADRSGDAGSSSSSAAASSSSAAGSSSSSATRACADTRISPAPAADAGVTLPAGVVVERAFGGLSFEFPVALVQAPGDDEHWYLVEQAGRIQRFDRNGAGLEQVLDLSATAVEPGHRRVEAGGEKGLLGLAFHPLFPVDARAFVSYTAPSAAAGEAVRSVVAGLSVSAASGRFDPDSHTTLLEQSQPFANHNGGQIAFGPDGFLYIGLGDGGSGGDPLGHGQNCDSLLGGLLRVRVSAAGASPAYRIPAGNPLAGDSQGRRPELFAWGFRNPWRWSFDLATGQLWYGDVGQNQFEEIGVAACGENHGWRLREGLHEFLPDSPDASCPAAALVAPRAEYSHADGDCSVTGGYVYRGTEFPRLQGIYLYADFCSGRIRGLPAGSTDPADAAILLDTDLRVTAFAQANNGELYLLDRAGGIFRIGLPAN